MTDTIDRSQTHATFVIERSYPAPVARIWRALSDTDERAHWFGGGDAFAVSEAAHDFRVGGQGVEAGQWHGGPTSVFRSTYTDIIDQVRIVFTYDMWVDEKHLSTSLTTIGLEPEGDEGAELVEEAPGALFPPLDAVEAVEVHTLFGVGQPCPVAFGLQADGGE